MVGSKRQTTTIVNCRTSKGFIEALSPVGNHFGGGRLDEGQHLFWVFRGQPDAEMGLLPTAFRRDTKFRTFWGKEAKPDDSTTVDQIRCELFAVARFFHLADKQGLKIPGDSQELRTLLTTRIFDIFKNSEKVADLWPRPSLLPLIGLAQHYGIPTRLLDWSRSPYVAAYFAVSSLLKAKRRKYKTQRIAVWALSLRDCMNLQYREDFEAGPLNPWASKSDRTVDEEVDVKEGLQIATVASIDNPNLLRQQGLFTLYRPRGMGNQPKDPSIPLEDSLGEDWQSTLNTFEKHLFIKFTLPFSECNSALQELPKLGFSGATLFAGFDGVSRGLEEEDLWPDNKRPKQRFR